MSRVCYNCELAQGIEIKGGLCGQCYNQKAYYCTGCSFSTQKREIGIFHDCDRGGRTTRGCSECAQEIPIGEELSRHSNVTKNIVKQLSRQSNVTKTIGEELSRQSNVTKTICGSCKGGLFRSLFRSVDLTPDDR